MIAEMTNLSLFHHSCRGLHAPRDKYIFDRAVAEGYLQIDVDPETLIPVFSFSGYPNNELPSESNIEDTISSLDFYCRDEITHSLSGIDMLARYFIKKDIKKVTLKEVTSELQKHYDDICDRKGAIHFRSQYVKVLLNNPAMVQTYLKNGGPTHVFY